MKKRLKRQLTTQRRDTKKATERRKYVKLRWRVKSSVWRYISEGLEKWARSRPNPFEPTVLMLPGGVLMSQIQLFARDNLYLTDDDPRDVDAG